LCNKKNKKRFPDPSPNRLQQAPVFAHGLQDKTCT
jgi:hypothetical protein